MLLNEYFEKVFVIHCEHRVDRKSAFTEELRRHRIEAEVFPGIYLKHWGNDGCSMSHRKLLDHVAAGPWGRVLVLEDDFKVVHDDFQERFAAMIGLVPVDWELLYLGGHYAEAPRARVNEHVILTGYMKTTSSYGITQRQAAKMAPAINRACMPIDDLFAPFSSKDKSYIFQPRLIVQRASYSDLQERFMDNSACMLDPNHEQLV